MEKSNKYYRLRLLFLFFVAVVAILSFFIHKNVDEAEFISDRPISELATETVVDMAEPNVKVIYKADSLDGISDLVVTVSRSECPQE